MFAFDWLPWRLGVTQLECDHVGVIALLKYVHVAICAWILRTSAILLFSHQQSVADQKDRGLSERECFHSV